MLPTHCWSIGTQHRYSTPGHTQTNNSLYVFAGFTPTRRLAHQTQCIHNRSAPLLLPSTKTKEHRSCHTPVTPPGTQNPASPQRLNHCPSTHNSNTQAEQSTARHTPTVLCSSHNCSLEVLARHRATIGRNNCRDGPHTPSAAHTHRRHSPKTDARGHTTPSHASTRRPHT